MSKSKVMSVMVTEMAPVSVVGITVSPFVVAHVSMKISSTIISVVSVMSPCSVSSMVTEVAPVSVVNITVMSSEITIIIPMVSNIMAPFSMITEVAPVSVVGIPMSPFSMSTVITVVAPGKGITMMSISMVSITVMAPWFMVLVSMNNSNLGMDVMGFMSWSVVVVMIPVVVMMVIMTPISVMIIMIPVVAPSLVVIMVAPSVVVIVVAPSIVIIMVVIVVAPSIVIIMVVIVVAPSIVIIMVVIMMDIMMFIMVSIWVHNSLSMLWCFLFLFSWLWCFLLWLCFSRFFLLSSLFSVHVALVEKRDSIHLLSKENLGKCKTKGVSEFIVMLVFPLGHSIHKFVVYILSIYNKIMINMEDEIPWVSEGLGHRFEFIEISSNCSFALLKLASNIIDN